MSAYLGKNFTAPLQNNYFIELNREIYEDQIKNTKLDMMPGFGIEWNYNKQFETNTKFISNDYYGKTNREFVRFEFLIVSK